MTSLLFFKGIKTAWQIVHSDFGNYYVSAKLILEKKDSLDKLYDNHWFQTQIYNQGINAHGKFSPFPPITAFVMLPVTPFKSLEAQRIFLLLNLGFACLGMFYIKKITGWNWANSILALLIFGMALFNNLAFGQLYVIIAVMMLIVFDRVESNRCFLPGVVLGCFSMLKYFPIVFAFSFLLIGLVDQKDWTLWQRNKYFRVVFYTMCTMISLIAFQVLFFGSQVFGEFVQSAFLPHLNSELANQGMYSFEFQSWDSLLRNLFVRNPVANPQPWINWPEGRNIIKVLISIFVLFLAAKTMIRFRKSHEREAVFIALPALAALVLLPASASYHFIFFLPALILLFRKNVINVNTQIVVGVLILVIGLMPYGIFFALGKSAGVLFAFPRLFAVTALFLVTVISLNRKQVTPT